MRRARALRMTIMAAPPGDGERGDLLGADRRIAYAARHAVGRRGVVMVARKLQGARLSAGYYLAPEKQRAAIGTRGGEGYIMRYAQHG